VPRQDGRFVVARIAAELRDEDALPLLAMAFTNVLRAASSEASGSMPDQG